MSCIVFVDGWNKQPYHEEVVYLAAKFPELDETQFEGSGYPKDSQGRHYTRERVYDDPFPEVVLGPLTWSTLSAALGLNTIDGAGKAGADELHTLLSDCMRLLSSACDGISTISMETIVEFSILAKFAIDRGRGIYWVASECDCANLADMWRGVLQ